MPTARTRSSSVSAPELARQALAALLAGLVAGALAAAFERDPSLNYRTFLYGSFASGSIGLWVFASAAIAATSRTPAAAALKTGCFLAATVATYYGMRYYNYYAAYSLALVQDAEKGVVHSTLYASALSWPSSRWMSLVAGLAASAAAAIVSYMIVKTALGSNAFWLWAMIPVFLLVFEGWTYFIPMLVYRGTSLLPALVDVVGAFSATALFVRMRSRARELSIIV